MVFDNSYNEQQLIQLITEGDEQAFSKLFDHYRNKIYSVALKLTHSTVLAEEIVGDVFLKIWLKRTDLMGIQNFSAYLFTIARNNTFKVLKQIAKNYKIILLNDNEQLLSHNNLEDYLMEKEYSSLLQQAINRLPYQQKQVYKLIKEEGLKREEAADFLHLQPETVKFHLAHAMKNIRSFCALHLDKIVAIGFFLLYT